MTRSVIALALALSLFGAGGWAQQHKAQQPDSENTASDEEEVLRGLLESEARALSIDTPQDQSIRDLVDAVMRVRIKNLLELSDEETRALYGVIGEYLDKIHSLKWDRGALQYYLRRDIDAAAGADAIAAKLKDAMEVEKNIALLLNHMVKKSGEVLTPRQQAQLFMFSFDFEKEISRLIQKAEEIAAGSDETLSEPINPRSGPQSRKGSGNSPRSQPRQ